MDILEALQKKAKNTQKVINDFRLICRQEIIQNKPDIILDGAHNVDKLNNLIEFVKTQKYQKLHLIFGAAEDKHYLPALKKLVPSIHYAYLTRFNNPLRKSANLKTLFSQVKKIKNIPTAIFHDSQMALEAAQKKASKNDLIVICGSFFLSGQLRQNWVSEEQILKNLSTSKQ